MKKLVELCVKAVIIEDYVEKMMPTKEARLRADDIWELYKSGRLIQVVARLEYNVITMLDALEKGGHLKDK